MKFTSPKGDSNVPHGPYNNSNMEFKMRCLEVDAVIDCLKNKRELGNEVGFYSQDNGTDAQKVTIGGDWALYFIPWNNTKVG